MKKRLMLVMTVMSALALAMTGVVSAQATQQETAAVVLEEAEGSGFQGIAVLHGQDDQTDIVTVVLPGDEGFLGGLFGGGDQDLGPVAIMSGTCEQPEEVIEELGQLQQLGAMTTQGQEGQEEQDQEGPWAAQASVQMSLDELLSGDYVLAVRQQDASATTEPGLPGGSPTPEMPGASPTPGPGQEVSVMACGELTMDAMVDSTVPTPGDGPELPGASPTPITPTPESGI